MGLFGNLFKKKSGVEEDYLSTSYLIPTFYSGFPIYQKKIVETPQEKNTEKYNRLEIYYPGKPLKEYKELLMQNGFVQETDVRFNKGPNCYVIVEVYYKGFLSKPVTKIAYHITR